MKLNRVAGILLPTVLILIAGELSAADSSSVDNRLADYPNFDTEGTEKCYSVANAAFAVGSMKESGLTSEKAIDVVREGIRAKALPTEAEDLYRLLIELAFSKTHEEKSTDKFREDMEYQCTTPDVRFCDVEIETALFVGKAKEEGAGQTKLSQMLFSKEGLSSQNFDILDMAFWPEHENKTAEEYSDYIANEWCAKYSKRERRKMFGKRDDEVQGVGQ